VSNKPVWEPDWKWVNDTKARVYNLGYADGLEAGMVWGAAIVAMAQAIRDNWGHRYHWVPDSEFIIRAEDNPVWKP
jgi:hypothetical protein